jgi:hypothetical protein
MDTLQLLVQKPHVYTVVKLLHGHTCEPIFSTFGDLELFQKLQQHANFFRDLQHLAKTAKCIALSPNSGNLVLCVHKLSYSKELSFDFPDESDSDQIQNLVDYLGQAGTRGAAYIAGVFDVVEDRHSWQFSVDAVAKAANAHRTRITRIQEDDQAKKFVNLVRPIITETLAEFSDAHPLVGQDASSVPCDGTVPIGLTNLFCVVRWALPEPNVRRDAFHYTAQLVLADNQKVQIGRKLTLESDELETLVSRLEFPVGPNGRSIADSVFSSGTADFVSEEFGAGGRDIPDPQDTKDAQRQEAENKVFKDLGRHIFYAPVHVGGVPWAALLTFSHARNASDERHGEIPDDVWAHNYLFYRTLVPQVCDRLRLKAKDHYRKHLLASFRDEFLDSVNFHVSERIILAKIEARWRELTTYFPYGLLGMKMSPHMPTENAITLPSGSFAELWVSDNTNRCFERSLKFDLFGQLDLRLLSEELTSVSKRISDQHRLRRLAVRTAAIAIMSRNMSHNMGSHVLASVASESTEGTRDQLRLQLKKRSELLHYLQERMDFLAELSTSVSYMSIPVTLREVAAGFSAQESVQDYICGTGEIATVSSSGGGNNIRIAALGGRHAMHALYVIFENVLRNAAKHGIGGNSEDLSGQVSLKYRADKLSDRPDLVRVRVWDRKMNGRYCGSRTKPLFEYINWVIEEDIIDSTDTLKLGNWGIRELMIAATYLRGISLETLDQPIPEFPLLTALVVDKNGNDLQSQIAGNLCYQFYIDRAKTALIVADFEVRKQSIEKLRESGIDVITSGRNIPQRHAQHQYMVMPDITIDGYEVDLPVRQIRYGVTDKLHTSIPAASLGDAELHELKSALDRADGNTVWKIVAVAWKSHICGRHACAGAKLCHGPDAPDTGCGERASGLADARSAVAFDRHGHLLARDQWGLEGVNQSLFWEQYFQPDDQYAPFETPLSGTCKAVEAEFLAAAVARVVIFDERVQDAIEQHSPLSYADRNQGSETTMRMADAMVKRRIYVPGHDLCPFKLMQSDETEQQYLGRLRRFQPSIENYLAEIKSGGLVDFLVIHQGILDGVAKVFASPGQISSQASDVTAWIQAEARDAGAELVICTGRGVFAEVIDEGVRCVPASSVLRWATHKPSKYHLYQLLCASRRPRHGASRRPRHEQDGPVHIDSHVG